MKIWTVHLFGNNWRRSFNQEDKLCLKGQAYIDNEKVNADNIITFFRDNKKIALLNTFLSRLNGFYAWVYEDANILIAGVDHIRSRPLFYGHLNNHLFLSDDAEWVRQRIGDKEMDLIAREEFQLAGYVTGAETLFHNVKQLQAGECLIARRIDTDLVVETHRYYRFLHQEPDEFNETDLRAGLDKVTVKVMQRLIDYANGRQIVVPLSGGYDSRLIVTLLKRLGYDNVLTFTYGVPGNKESEYSKLVAAALGLRWYFVEYNAKLWQEAWHTEERWEYQKWASGWTSVAHVQDWLAVKKLKQQFIVDEDCLFVPGHTGDFIAGGHIPDAAFTGKHSTVDNLSGEVFINNYCNAPLRISNQSVKYWKKRVLENVEVLSISTGKDLANWSEKWEWQERQAKFICNSVRGYEFFGYDWWMPLWDLDFVKFWETVPLQLRYKKLWYQDYVHSVFSYNSNLKNWIGNSQDKNSSKISSRIKTIIKLLHPVFINQLVMKFNNHKSLDYLCWDAKYSYINIKEMYNYGFSSIGINAWDILQSITEFLKEDK